MDRNEITGLMQSRNADGKVGQEIVVVCIPISKKFYVL